MVAKASVSESTTTLLPGFGTSGLHLPARRPPQTPARGGAGPDLRVEAPSGVPPAVRVEEGERHAGGVDDARIAGGCGAGPLVPPAGEGPELDVAPGGAAAPALECQA